MEMIQSDEEDTPLQQKLEHLGKVLRTACIAICLVVRARRQDAVKLRKHTPELAC